MISGLSCCLLLLGPTASAATLLHGPYATKMDTMRVPALDLSSHWVDVYYASNATQPLRFISFAHGAGGGLFIQPFVYKSLLHSLAAWGYVVAAPRACLFGDCHGLKGDYYKHQLEVIDWAHKEGSKGHTILSLVNFTGGVGITGHSMGGAATLVSSEAAHAQAYDVVAAVMLHAYTHEAGPPAIPFLAFTGTADTTAPMSMTEHFCEFSIQTQEHCVTRIIIVADVPTPRATDSAADASTPRGLVEKINATHQEPSDYHDKSEPYNPKLPQFVVAWFKLYLDRVNSSHGVDWDALVYGSGPDSLCGGGDGAMERCNMKRGST